MEPNHMYKCLEIASPGIRVRTILPTHTIPFLKSRTPMKLILIHYKNLNCLDTNYFQLTKNQKERRCTDLPRAELQCPKIFHKTSMEHQTSWNKPKANKIRCPKRHAARNRRGQVPNAHCGPNQLANVSSRRLTAHSVI